MITLQKAVLLVSGEQQQKLMYLRSLVTAECPQIVKALRFIDQEYTTIKTPKGYNLMKRDNKKSGFVYYVRYWHEGKMLPSKWCTHTNDYKSACDFAVNNRKSIITRYLGKTNGEVERFFSAFYDRDNPAFQSECKRGIEITEQKRRRFSSVMKNRFIPFLVEKGIRTFDEITVPVLSDFQDTLLAGGRKPQTVNDQMVAVKKVMRYLSRKGIIQDDPCLRLSSVPQKPEDKKTHGCYELEKLKGVFDETWEDEKSYLLNLLIHTTGMRNSEIKSFSKKDIMSISECHFIDLKKSKTWNGIRLVPLHETVYKKIMEYANGKDDTELIFSGGQRQEHCAADELGKKMGVSIEYRNENNITFYSGRHAWKTIMSAGGLGEDAEEFFIGHKVSSNVKKLYNHRDKQGQTLMIKKALEIFTILDQFIFS